jgi:hypothetical protein
MTKLTEEQEERIRQWASQGASLNEIHKRMGAELGLGLTYMEARLLVADLQVSLQDKNPPPKPAEGAPGEPGSAVADGETPPAGGGVRVSVDALAKPRSLVSGRVTFSDGVGAGWYLDQMGRLGLDLDTPGYRPSEADVMAFQRELEQALQRAGY